MAMNGVLFEESVELYIPYVSEISCKHHAGFDLERLRQFQWRQQGKIVVDSILGGFVTFDGVSGSQRSKAKRCAKRGQGRGHCDDKYLTTSRLSAFTYIRSQKEA